MAKARPVKLPPLAPEEFAAETSAWADVSRETLDRLKAYGDLLAKWQKAINLISRADLPDLWRRHFLDSAQLMPLLPPAPGAGERVIADMGSGAGFPGLVLAILGAGEVHLIESDGRKCAFLAEAARITRARAVVHNVRLDPKRPPALGFRADVVTSRALAPLPKLLEYAFPLLKSGGICLFLKGAGVSEELTAARKVWNMRIEQLPSRSGGAGVILRLGDIARGGQP